MMGEKIEFNPEIFNLDPKARNSQLFTMPFIFSSDEMSRLRDYLVDYYAQYPILKSIDELLLATYLFRFDISNKTQDKKNIMQIYQNVIKSMIEKAHSSNAADQKLINSALNYCLASVSQVIDSSEISADISNDWQLFLKNTSF